MWGLTVGEIIGVPRWEPFLQTLARGDLAAFGTPAEVPDLRGYVELALRGGFPEPALELTGAARNAWLEGYLTQLLTRDAESLRGLRDPELLRRYFQALAVNSAGLASEKTLYDAAGISRETALAYERLLANLFVLDLLPAWSNNRLSRLVRGRKRYITDPALMAVALAVDQPGVMRDSAMLGRLIETFVLSQIRPHAALDAYGPRLYHLREKNGRHEIDLLAERSAGEIVAIETKTTASPGRSDAKHLERLRDQLGERFLAGAVLHTGPRPFRLGERIYALPICTLWG